MDPVPNISHVKFLNDIRELEGTIKQRFGNKPVSYNQLAKEHLEIRNTWKKYKKSIDIQKEHAKGLKKLHGLNIEHLQEAGEHINFPLSWDKKELEAIKFLKDYDAANENEINAHNKLKNSLKDIKFYQSELDKIAMRYISINRKPDIKDPFYTDINLRIAIIKSQSYKLLIPSEIKEQQSSLSPEEFKKLKERTPLPKEELSQLDKALESAMTNLIIDSKKKPENKSKKPSSFPGVYFVQFNDLVKANPSYAAYLLTKVPYGDAQNVTELLFRKLEPAAIATLAHELVRHELATSRTPETFLRLDDVKERFISKFQEEQTKPLLEKTYQYIKNLSVDKSIELDPAKKENTGEADQRDIKMLVTSSLRKILTTISEQGMPEPMSKIYRTILNSGFGNEESLIASLLFLRSICPNLLTTDITKAVQKRNSVLLTKILMFIVNKAEPEEKWLKFIVDPPSFIESSQPAIKEIIPLITKQPLGR